MLILLLLIPVTFVALAILVSITWVVSDLVSHRGTYVPTLMLSAGTDGSTLALSDHLCGCWICRLGSKIRGDRYRFRDAALIGYVRSLMVAHAGHVKFIRGEASLSVKHLSFFERAKLWRLTRVASREIKRDERKATEKHTIERRGEVEAGLRKILGD